MAWVLSAYLQILASLSFQVIHDILPKLAKLRTDTLMEFCKDAQFKLEVIPSSTVEYVESLSFLDEIQEKVTSNPLFFSVFIESYCEQFLI